MCRSGLSWKFKDGAMFCAICGWERAQTHKSTQTHAVVNRSVCSQTNFQDADWDDVDFPLIDERDTSSYCSDYANSVLESISL
jgi:uncharacterized Zn finger protein (UPF0148 family)